jgi:hypothetical protein
MIRKQLRKLLSGGRTPEKLVIGSGLSREDKKIVERKLEEDVFNITDPEFQVRPQVSPVNYYRLHAMDFIWIILDPMSRMVTEFSEKTGLGLAQSIKITCPEQKLLYFWWYLDGQVTNGGFSQFIYNGYDRYFQPVLNGLRLLPDRRYYKLVEQVYAYYLKEGLDTIDRSQIDYFKDKFNDNKLLPHADSEYLKINNQLYEDIENFIRNNQASFIQPVEKTYTGIIEIRKENILERLEVENGKAEGTHTKYIDDAKTEEIIYHKGREVVKRRFREGVLYEEEKKMIQSAISYIHLHTIQMEN